MVTSCSKGPRRPPQIKSCFWQQQSFEKEAAITEEFSKEVISIERLGH